MLNRLFKSKKSSPLYIINGSHFEIETSGIVGIINSELKFCWAIDLYAKEGNIENHIVTPKFSFTELEPAQDFVFDKSFIWNKTTAYNTETDNWKGDFYIFDAHYFEVRVEFIKLSKTEFQVIVDGYVNQNPETYSSVNFVPFKIKQNIPFNGILVEIDNREKAYSIARKYLEVSEMNWFEKNENKQIYNNWIK